MSERRLQIIWLASYPKSGNTWLRFLLYNYLYGNVRTSNDISKMIPDIHTLKGMQIDPIRVSRKVICKTHFAWGDTHPNHDDTIGFIYILRHPKDVLLSNLNYFRLFSPDKIDAATFSTNFINAMGVPEWRETGIGSWPEHADSWLKNNSLPHIVIRYEDLHTKMEECFMKIIKFLGIEQESDRMNMAISASSFNNMRALELKEHTDGELSAVFQSSAPGGSEYAFMSKGETGHSLSTISPDIDEYFDQSFEHILKDFGY